MFTVKVLDNIFAKSLFDDMQWAILSKDLCLSVEFLCSYQHVQAEHLSKESTKEVKVNCAPQSYVCQRGGCYAVCDEMNAPCEFLFKEPHLSTSGNCSPKTLPQNATHCSCEQVTTACQLLSFRPATYNQSATQQEPVPSHHCSSHLLPPHPKLSEDAEISRKRSLTTHTPKGINKLTPDQPEPS